MFIGKILFGLSAFVLTWHPLYAFLGIAAGAVFDLWIEKVLLPGNSEALWQQNFSMLIIVLMSKFAKADGFISKNEIQAIRRNIKMKKDETAIVGHYFDMARYDMDGIEYVMQDLLVHCRGRENIFPFLLEVMCQIAVADGKLYREHAHLIRVATDIWNIPSSVYLRLEQVYLNAAFEEQQRQEERYEQRERAEQNQKKEVGTPLGGEEPYGVLGLDKGAPFDEVKKAYRQLVKDQHPDRMRGEDKSEQQIKAAENNLTRINAAFKAIEDAEG